MILGQESKMYSSRKIKAELEKLNIIIILIL